MDRKNEDTYLERNYIEVTDRRMPWCLFPGIKFNISQKANIMKVYKEQLRLWQYYKAKSSSIFAEWNVISIPIGNKFIINRHAKANNVQSTDLVQYGRSLRKRSVQNMAEESSDEEFESQRAPKRKHSNQ